MVNFASLKKSSSDLARLTKEIEKINTVEDNKDPRYYKVIPDPSGNASVIIRFLPAPAVDGDDGLPWVRIFTHFFKGPTGKYYVNNSLTTFGKNSKDPVSEYNTQLWNSTSDDDAPARKQARAQKRKLEYISNIKVISDKLHPENEGKVFLYRYGKKIFDKISSVMNPTDGDKPMNPFDMWEGANFKLKMKQVAGYPNYDDSSFAAPSALSDDDKELERIWKTSYSLLAEVAPDKFKTYDELKAELENVLGEPLSDSPKKFAASSSPKGKFAKTPDDDEDDSPLPPDEEDEKMKKYFADLDKE